MDNKYEYMNPNDIEKHSFEIIEQELEIELPSDIKPIVKRVIHTTADFSYAENMYFSPDAIKTALGEIKSGVTFVTDTNMALSGINKKALKEQNAIAFEALPMRLYMSALNGTSSCDSLVTKIKKIIFYLINRKSLYAGKEKYRMSVLKRLTENETYRYLTISAIEDQLGENDQRL